MDEERESSPKRHLRELEKLFEDSNNEIQINTTEDEESDIMIKLVDHCQEDDQSSSENAKASTSEISGCAQPEEGIEKVEASEEIDTFKVVPGNQDAAIAEAAALETEIILQDEVIAENVVVPISPEASSEPPKEVKIYTEMKAPLKEILSSNTGNSSKDMSSLVETESDTDPIPSRRASPEMVPKTKRCKKRMSRSARLLGSSSQPDFVQKKPSIIPDRILKKFMDRRTRSTYLTHDSPIAISDTGSESSSDDDSPIYSPIDPKRRRGGDDD